MKKSIKYGIEGRDNVKIGVDYVADAVKVTLGPKGRNVIIDREYSNPIVTKDGVTVAKSIELEDPAQNMGARLIIEVAAKTADMAGDGTTTATILAQSILTNGLKSLALGTNPIEIKKGIDKGAKWASEYIKNVAVKIDKTSDKLLQVAIISANSDEEIGNKIIEALGMVKEDGIITIEEAKGAETTVTMNQGMTFDRGYYSPHFINNKEKQAVIYEDAFVIVMNQKLTNVAVLFKLLTEISNSGKPVLIITDDIEEAPLNNLIVNKLNGILEVAVIKSPGYGGGRIEEIRDVASLVGTYVLGDSIPMTDINKLSIKDLGKAQKIIITKDSTTIVNDLEDNKKLNDRIALIKKELEEETTAYGIEVLKRRLSKLTGGVATINVGASSEVEMLEKKDRFDDALHAVIAAIDEGIVPGGGVTLLRITSNMINLKGNTEGEEAGLLIFKKALEEPLKQMLLNAGIEDGSIIATIKKSDNDYGYDVKEEEFCNMLDKGIIDPAKVVRLAIENASSIAGMILSTECVISNVKQDNIII